MYIAAACHSFVQSRRSTLLLCRVGVTTYDYECAIYYVHWMAQSYSTYQRSKHNKEEGGRADSWWNPQRTKGIATRLITSDHSVWFIMVCMFLFNFPSKSSYFIRSFHISSSNQNFIRSSSWRSLSNLCLSFWDSLPNAYCSSFKFKGLTIYSDWYQ